MAKKSWFSIVKRFFVSETHANQKNKEKRRRWVFGKITFKKRLASLTAPPSPPPSPSPPPQPPAPPSSALKDQKTQNEADEERCLELDPNSMTTIHAQNEAIELAAKKCERQQAHESAAVKIQTAFRGYLAKKALRALKGIVKLQAIIRGRAVRRQAMTTLKCLQSIINIQSNACARRFQTIEDNYHCDEHNQFQNLRDKIIRMDSNSQRRWDDSLVSKEEAEALFLSRKEAMLKRERIKEYSCSHRKSEELDRNKVNGRWRYWLDQWVDTQLSKSKELEDLDTMNSSNARRREEFGGKQLRLRNFQRQKTQIEGMDSSPVFMRRKSSYHKKQCSLGDENSFTNSPVVPTYMAATKSAKAKARSLSSPKLRAGSFDTFSESYSPCKNNNMYLMSSIASEVPISSRRKMLGKSTSIQKRSPSLKGLPSLVKSRQPAKDQSFDSECSVSYLDRQGVFR